MKFTEFALHPSVQAGIDELGFVDCTPIQETSIPHILEGRDVAGLAQTGTGKTAAFLLPLMDRIVRSREPVNPDQPAEEKPNRPLFKNWRKSNFILVLVPTRELAEQVCENAAKLGKRSQLRAASIYGGTGYEAQKAALKSGVEFIVATPGRLIDLYKEHLVDLNQVRAVVFDEADRMFDMGFKDDMKYILRRIPQERQFLVYSATLNFDVLNTAYEFGANPVEVNVSRDQAKAENVVDEIFHVGQNEKPQILLSLIQKHQPRQVIVFSNFKHNIERVAKFLSANGVPALGISSLISQAQRTRIMEMFKDTSNDRNVLVATDLAARGLDIRGVDLVINYELPDDPENYVHRIGRTGRAGAEGRAFSLVSDRDVEALQRIESYLGHKVTIGWVDEADVVKEFKPYVHESSHRPQHAAQGGGGGFSRGPRDYRKPREGGRGPGPRREARGHQGPRHEHGPRNEQGQRSERGRPDQRYDQARQHDANQPREPRGDQRPEQRPDRHSQHRHPKRGFKHRPQLDGRQPGPARQENGQGRQRFQRPQHSGHSNSGPSSTSPSMSASNASVVGKVKGFLKRIFG